MRTYKLVMFLMSFMFCSFYLEAQNHKFYLRAISQNFDLQVTDNNGVLVYKGRDRSLNKIFNQNDIYVFKKAFNHSQRSNLQRTWYIEGDSSRILNDFLQAASHIFEFGEYIGYYDNEELLAGDTGHYSSNQNRDEIQPPYVANSNTVKSESLDYYLSFPNDYGATSPVANLGIEAVLDNFDFIGVPEAWDYTTGSSDIIIGLSDARLLTDFQGLTSNDPDFVNKTTLFYDSSTPTIGGGHGYGVGMRMAGQGDNGVGSTGICYDCNIYATNFGPSNYDDLLEISYNGARIINCSWRWSTPTETQQLVINEIYENGTIVVAAAGNTASLPKQYPASYEHVISVGGVGHKRDLIVENAVPDGNVYDAVRAAKYYIGAKTWVDINETDPEEFINTAVINPTSASTRNDAIDINAPGSETFSYGAYLINAFNGNDDPEGSIAGLHTFVTSSTTPQVSGTLGLMLDLNQCLSFEEAESILKITSTNIDDIPAHQSNQWLNQYGSGALHTGRAVKLVYDLLNPSETAYLENQKFTRWDFEFKGVSEKIVIRNQKFTDSSTLKVVAKNLITIEESSLIEPDIEGFASLEIEPNLTLETTCSIGDGTRVSSKEKEEKDQETSYNLYPTKVISTITIEKVATDIDQLEAIEIYDLFNRKVFSQNKLHGNKMNFDLSNIKRGIYIVKGYTLSREVILTKKIIKVN